MASPLESEDRGNTMFYICHHEPRRELPVMTNDFPPFAQEDYTYDMLTAPITTDVFQSRVLAVLSPYLDDSPANASSFASNIGLPPPTLSSLTPAETAIAPGNNISKLILTTSQWIDLASVDPLIADVSRQVLNLEVQYAAFCGANNLVISGPRKVRGHYQPDGLSSYARAIQEALKHGPFIHFHLLLPMNGDCDVEPGTGVGDLDRFRRPSFKSHTISGNGPLEDVFDTWDLWHTTRTLCNYNAKLFVALTISRRLPPISLQSRWCSEPLRLLHFPGGAFYENKYGETSLSQQQKQLVFQFMRLRNPPWIVLSDVGPLTNFQHNRKYTAFLEDIEPAASVAEQDKSKSSPTPAEASKIPSPRAQKRTGVGSHLRCMRQLEHELPPKSPIEQFGAVCQDHLQNPLQPLSDNLESITYEVFEKDPVKYDWYERAITLVLRRWQAQSNPASGLDGRVVIAVVGAGRGPLVTRALQASTNSGVEIDLWAVEKNPNAYILLQRQNAEKWNQRVTLVQSDMRTWMGPCRYGDVSSPAQVSRKVTNTVHFHVDILVSELLGSFGDNELSPECIDGVQRQLNPKHGISIPCSYTAHLTPIAAPKLHADILARTASGNSDASQVPYVVMLQAVDTLSTAIPAVRPDQIKDPADRTMHSKLSPRVLRAWEFSHPKRFDPLNIITGNLSFGRNEHNRRFARLNFPCRDRGACHGLGGYFEAVLYDGDNEGSNAILTDNEKGPPTAQIGSLVDSGDRVELSINPLNADQKSKDMISWFPLFFPLKVEDLFPKLISVFYQLTNLPSKIPLYFPDNSLLSVSIWRQTDGRQVWYEWMVESFMLLEVTPDGTQKVERLGSTNLHSSLSSGCLL